MNKPLTRHYTNYSATRASDYEARGFKRVSDEILKDMADVDSITGDLAGDELEINKRLESKKLYCTPEDFDKYINFYYDLGIKDVSQEDIDELNLEFDEEIVPRRTIVIDD